MLSAVSELSPGAARASFWAGWSVAFLLGSILLVAVVLPPFVSEPFRQFLMVVFSSVCHQLSDRSPTIDGVQLAVCHRCLGVYAALAVAPFAFLTLVRWDSFISRNARWFILAGILIPAVDWLGDVAGVWSNTPFSRIATGSAFGLAAGYFLCRAIVELFYTRTLKRRAPTSA